MASLTQLRVPVHTLADAREARRVAAGVARRAGLSDAKLADVEIVTSELAKNLARHADHGTLFIRLMAPLADGVELLSFDSGPGIEDVAASMTDGYSTAGSAGTGLGAVQRLASRFAVHARPNGTLLVAQLTMSPEPAPPRFELGGISIPRRGETACGDAWAWHGDKAALRVVMLDGLGHGPRAAEASESALCVFDQDPMAKPDVLMQSMHVALRSTRGAAAAIVDVTAGKVCFTGVGNIAARIVDADEKSRGLVCLSGTLGAAIPRIRTFDAPFPAGAQLVVHTDGVSSRWADDVLLMFGQQPPSMTAGALVREAGREHDDATVAMIRCRY